MSGGHFDHLESRIFSLIEEIEESREVFLSLFDDENRPIAEKAFGICADYLFIGASLARRIDYVISGDDDPEDFFRRVAEDFMNAPELGKGK